METGRDWSQASDEEVQAAAAAVSDYSKEAPIILAEASRRKISVHKEGSQGPQQVDEGEQPPKPFLALLVSGLFLLWLNMYLSAVQVTPLESGDPFIERYMDALTEWMTFDAYILGATTVDLILAVVVVLISLIFRKNRGYSVALALTVSMSLLLVSHIFRLLIQGS